MTDQRQPAAEGPPPGPGRNRLLPGKTYGMEDGKTFVQTGPHSDRPYPALPDDPQEQS